MWEYSEKLKEHFFNPRNVGEIKNPDAEATVGNLMCGDALHLMLKIDGGRIADARFQTFGCASAIASASALTDMIKGMRVEEAEKLTNDDIIKYLDGMPAAKVHCSVMGMEALQKALATYRGEKIEQEGEIVCKCFEVTDKLIEKVVREHNLKTVEEVTNYTKAGGACGNCHDKIREIIASVRGIPVEEVPSPAPKEAFAGRGGLTNLQRIKLIEEALDNHIRPMMHQDGGDVELVDVDRNKVYVVLKGRCANCPMSGATVNEVVQERLRKLVAPDIEVHSVKESPQAKTKGKGTKQQ